MAFEIRPYGEGDLAGMCEAWNEVVAAGNAFPQTEPLAVDEAREYFAAQTHCGVVLDGGKVQGVYILHPNNIGRLSHVANASYAVASSARGHGLGRALVEDSLAQAAAHGFRGLQFNAVVASNVGAIGLYEKLGFTRIGTIPGGFRNLAGEYEDMHVFYHAC